MTKDKYLDHMIFVGLLCCLVYQNWDTNLWVSLGVLIFVNAGLPMLLVIVTFPEEFSTLLKLINEE